MQNNADMQQPEVIDLLDIWCSITKNVKFIRKVTLITTGLALAYIFVAPSVYESTALLRIKPRIGIATSMLEGPNMMGNTQLLATYWEMLKSRSVVGPALEKNVKSGKQKNSVDYGSFVSGITTKPISGTDMFVVSVKGSTPEEAQEANNALLDSFFTRLTEMERTQMGLTRAFVEERLAASQNALYDAENSLIQFQKTHTIINPDEAVRLVAERIGAMDKIKAENQVNLEAAQSKTDAAKDGMVSGTLGFADNEVIQAYNGEIAKLESQRVAYATKYTTKHPAMVKINQEIEKLRAELRQAIDKAVGVAQSNLGTIEKIQAQYGKDMAALTDDQKEYVRLLRNVSVSQEIYYMLAKRLEETKIAEAAVSQDVQIVDSGNLPTSPVAPKKAVTILLGFLLGLLGSCGWVTFMSVMNRTINTTEDVENYLGIPVLGQIPSVDSLNRAKADSELTFAQRIWRTLWKK